MRKLLMITSAILGLGCLYPTTISAQTCTAAPSCADMGYTKTEADCSGKNTLKCPFDLTAVSCEDGDSSSGGGQWDWENMVDCSFLDFTSEKEGDTTYYTYNYTAPVAGCFLIGRMKTSADGSNSTIRIGVTDNLGNVKMPTTVYPNAFVHTVCVDKGYIVQGRGTSTIHAGCDFIPYKGKASVKDNSSCEKGDYYYDDDTCSFFNIKDKTAIGVVVDAENRKIISIEKKASLAFASDSSSYTSVYSKITSTTDGKTNTNKLISAGASKFPVAQYCNNLTIDNKTWYVPASNEFTMSKKVASTIGVYSNYLWTSTQYNSTNVVTMIGSGGTTFASFKGSVGYNTDGSTYIPQVAICIAKY